MPLFFGGLPTAPDLAKIEEAFGIPTPGTVITYEEFGRVIGAVHGTTRFKTVAFVWRRNLRRLRNVIFKAEGGAFTALDPKGRVDFASRGCRQGLRKMVRHSEIAARTDRSTLSPEDARICSHLAQVGAAHILADRTAAKSPDFLLVG